MLNLKSSLKTIGIWMGLSIGLMVVWAVTYDLRQNIRLAFSSHINPLTTKCTTVFVEGSLEPLRQAQMRNAPKRHTYCTIKGEKFLLEEIIYNHDFSEYEVNNWRLVKKNGKYIREYVEK